MHPAYAFEPQTTFVGYILEDTVTLGDSTKAHRDRQGTQKFVVFL